jgi:transcriptional regulator with XRE-family HTH domain
MPNQNGIGIPLTRAQLTLLNARLPGGNKKRAAEKIGIARPFLSNVLAGRTRPSAVMLRRIARYCGLDARVSVDITAVLTPRKR